MPKLGKEFDQIVTFRCPWEMYDESRFHAFCMDVDWANYMRVALRKYNLKCREKASTPEVDLRLKEMGGWPSREKQKEKKEIRIKKMIKLITEKESEQDYADEETKEEGEDRKEGEVV